MDVLEQTTKHQNHISKRFQYKYRLCS